MLLPPPHLSTFSGKTLQQPLSCAHRGPEACQCHQPLHWGPEFLVRHLIKHITPVFDPLTFWITSFSFATGSFLSASKFAANSSLLKTNKNNNNNKNFPWPHIPLQPPSVPFREKNYSKQLSRFLYSPQQSGCTETAPGKVTSDLHLATSSGLSLAFIWWEPSAVFVTANCWDTFFPWLPGQTCSWFSFSLPAYSFLISFAGSSSRPARYTPGQLGTQNCFLSTLTTLRSHLIAELYAQAVLWRLPHKGHISSSSLFKPTRSS